MLVNGTFGHALDFDDGIVSAPVHPSSVVVAALLAGVQRNFGTMGKPLHTGWAARNAVVAVELAAAGFSAAQDALEADSGFFAVYGNDRSDPGRVLNELGNPYAIDDPGMSLKRYACCYASHRPIEGLLALRRVLNFSEHDIESVRCVLAPGSLRALIYPRPRNGLEGKFSLEYALAAGVIDPHYSLWTFSDEAVNRPAAHALLPRITVVEDARCAVGDAHAATRGPSRRGFVEVHAITRDGQHAMSRVDKLPGSPDQPLEWSELRAKFLDCAGAAGLDAGRASRAFDQLAALENCENVTSIAQLLRR